MSEPDLRKRFAAAMRALTPKQRLYVRALPTHAFKRRKCCVELGFSSATLHAWLRQPKFIKALELQNELYQAIVDVSNRRILEEYARLAFSDMRGAFNDDGTLKAPAEWDDETAAAVQAVDTQERKERAADGDGEVASFELVRKVKFHDKRAALDALARMRGMLVDRHEVTGKDGAPIAAEPNADEIARRIAFLFAAGLHKQAETQGA